MQGKERKFMPALLTSPKHVILFGEMGCYSGELSPGSRPKSRFWHIFVSLPEYTN